MIAQKEETFEEEKGKNKRRYLVFGKKKKKS